MTTHLVVEGGVLQLEGRPHASPDGRGFLPGPQRVFLGQLSRELLQNQTHHKESDEDVGKANSAQTTTKAFIATNSRLLSCRYSSAPPSSWPACLPDPSPSFSDQKSSLSSAPR